MKMRYEKNIRILTDMPDQLFHRSIADQACAPVK